MIDYYRIQRIYDELEQPGFFSSITSFFASESHLISKFKSFAANAIEPSTCRGGNLTLNDTYNLVYLFCQFNQDNEYDRLMTIFKKHLTAGEYGFLSAMVKPCTAHFYQSKFTLEQFEDEVNNYLNLTNKNEVRITIS